ncbi:MULTISPECIES: helix-turn-helix domain-containing protein [Stenotrophomonas]|jgi:transcriptional regulator with XRE-family HTH domain|uniref:helix-turn-helix domain-containing protein n=1 Tax=Stenotrophomonas TaxID=40323 RepID=UPI000669DD89|nr:MULTISPECIES: helix-turn-helix transcriptional regulator [Stenotrophomonas]KMU64697.1 transcriptional regulator, XRE family [Stenotrophomonas maltophilia]MBC9090494.1 helix-turn-helix transcriptional regulator [Stenotrophomonas maltophilia]MBH1519119.1 helix-turn-helix transcriptional regulator [Stenotrophomonas maltophilia]MCF3466273.1 helix-turn-helix domain-containing protein [Stenotrophomonas maltophilia]MCF3484218.1 helix-turn-helix domain-containing protein [Stenotrophomonas maltophil
MTTKTPPRLLTAAEVGDCIRQFRQLRHWSQEQLAEISGLNVRTVQRVEQGDSASFDTRRALARAFDFNDIDALNKPFSLPTDEELQVAQAQFERDYITLAVSPLTAGRELARLIVSCDMDLSEPAFELSREAASEFAALVDYYREYRDCHDLYSEVDKLDIYEELQQHIETLREQGVSLFHGQRTVVIRMGSGVPMDATVLYVVAFRLGQECSQIVTPKAARIG